ncbi:hypothetical protein J437_LFUL014099 [Ladona fulva]|uniref:Uncharacterized protein n=1 Tax=Ladona fulva TaxID=123851 RepID=A0A8K0KJM6_LADFU|nr:hypothetical protein J437_LFUL014099 [Ladona fulva]
MAPTLFNVHRNSQHTHTVSCPHRQFSERWHARRKLLTNTLHKSVLEVFLSLMSQEADMLVHRLGEQLSENAEWSEGFDVVRLAKLCALEATCKTIMGINVHEQSEEDYVEYVTAIER